jgi:hypothetical protein
VLRATEWQGCFARLAGLRCAHASIRQHSVAHCLAALHCLQHPTPKWTPRSQVRKRNIIIHAGGVPAMCLFLKHREYTEIPQQAN